MDFIKQWTLTVSITLIISIIFSILSPKGNMGKFFKIILTLFIFISFIYPIKNARLDFEIPSLEDSAVIEEEENTYEKIITNSISSALENGGYFSIKVSADIKYNDNEIEIKKLVLYIPDEYEKEQVKSYVLNEMGLNAEVYYLGE